VREYHDRLTFFVFQNQVTYPGHALNGPIVTIVDADTGSDAELLAISFRQSNGKRNGCVVGQRTWGGLLTVADGGVTLVDGGFVSFPSQNVVTLGGESHPVRFGAFPNPGRMFAHTRTRRDVLPLPSVRP
jgi:hypothetical protein|tara:strand:+ start:2955 stop:3344 length:390 start_codon:yes stop_codon:yes gene_type:complete